MAEVEKIRVLGFSGSLRKASHNTGALQAALELVPAEMELEIFNIAPIPLYNHDVSEQEGFPLAVEEFRQKIAAAAALLIVTPEYNYSIPGVLKNAIDWASRPPNQPFNGKPVAIMGAGAGFGTARAQYHLRQVCFYLNMFPLNKPEVMIQRTWEKFDADGRLTDEETRKQIKALLEALVPWAQRFKVAV